MANERRQRWERGGDHVVGVVVWFQLIKKAATNEEKASTKAIKEARQDFYGYSIVDGRIEKVRSRDCRSASGARVSGSESLSPRAMVARSDNGLKEQTRLRPRIARQD